MSDEQTARRLVENEIMARTGNRNAGKAIANLALSVAKIMFFCECSNEACLERIPMSLATYTLMHQQNNRFIIKPEHATGSVESVVERNPNYWIVQKFQMNSGPV